LKDIKVVPRFIIDGKYYTIDEIGRDKAQEIVVERMDAAFDRLGYERIQEPEDTSDRKEEHAGDHDLHTGIDSVSGT